MSALEGRSLGSWVKLPASESVELLALGGLDFVVVDMEHAPLNLETTYRHITAARLHRIPALVRIPTFDPGYIQRVLDAGADGIMVPHVDTPDHARAVADAARFPPRGGRGVGNTSRAGLWGALPRTEYLRHGNDHVEVVVQLESAEAISHAAAIASTDGVSALFVGTADLSVSEGHEEASAQVSAWIDEAVAGARSANRIIGTAVGTGEAVPAQLERGFDFVVAGNDATMLRAAAAGTVEAAGRGGRE